MAVQITVLGLGQIGASMGMALRGSKTPILRIGFDKNPGVGTSALALGAVDDLKKLRDAVKNADIVLLCLPLGEIHETLKEIGPLLKEGVVVMDTAPVKAEVLKWAGEFIPEGRFHLGLVPALTAEALAAPESGLNAARPDLFKNTIMAVDAPPGTPAEVEQLAFSLARTLGAKPMLTGPTESDGLMAIIHLLPQLTSAALINATIDEAGWAEARKLSGAAFAAVTRGAADYDDAKSLQQAVLGNREATLRALDRLLVSISDLREALATDDAQGSAEYLNQAFEARDHWLDERTAAPWLKEGTDTEELPDLGRQMLNALFGSSIVDRVGNKKKK